MREIILISVMDLDQRAKLWVDAAANVLKLRNIVVGVDNMSP
jgi:hypothetical protein